MTIDRGDPDWTRPPELPSALADLALHHGVEGWALRRASAAGVVLPGVQEAVHGALARHQRTLAELEVVDAVLSQADVPFAVVKGPALVAQFYDGPQWRSSADLDLLVRPRDVGRALEALESGGARVVGGNWPLLERAGVHELVLLGPVGGAIDLHWSLGPRWGTASSSPPAALLLWRAPRIRMGSVEAATLDWADTVVHLASHAAAAGGNRLRWCADLRAALALASKDASALLVERAAEWSAAPALHLMLTRVGHTLGCEPPAGLLEALAPGAGWSALVRGVDALLPIAMDAGGPSLPRLVARSARGDALASWRALASKATAAVLGRAGVGEGPLTGEPDDPRSAYYRDGGPQARASFLAGLEALER